ncbi:MAG: L-serine ammonia-lyase, partial [Gammaproteobacteria bacterium]|nr:L-serine ammonia-lyase [Gammaproteobacteria bacterium]
TEIENTGKLLLGGTHSIAFKETDHILFHFTETLPKHTNGMRFTAYDSNRQVLTSEIYYSVGGGFIVTDAQFGQPPAEPKTIPFPFTTADMLLTLCRENNLTISQLMLANERVSHDDAEIRKGLLHIAATMEDCLRKGCRTEGILPGGLNVRRRGAALYKKLMEEEQNTDTSRQARSMNWLNAYAMAVNEENAAGGRVVTAPTNGAAGIIPAVLQYYKEFCDSPTDEGIIDFLLTAGAIAILYKLQASISGAEVGCQGEVGVACSMAAGALAAALGGTLAQVECAAEIGMEHNLGLTCDPPKGLVQIPCIERNAMGAVKAVNAAGLALAEDGFHKISLDTVIKTMRQTGKDMMSIYKETSLGGLAANIPEC